MHKNVCKRLARLSPSLLLLLLALCLFQSARKLHRSAETALLQTAVENSVLCKQQLDTQASVAIKSLEALTTSYGFIEAWDQRDAVGLLHEISGAVRFLERIGAAEQIILRNDAGEILVNLSSAETRLPSGLAEQTGNSDTFYLTEQDGEVFSLRTIPFKGTTTGGTLQVWQAVAFDSHNTLWAALNQLMERDATRVEATLLHQPENSTFDDWQLALDRKNAGELPYLVLEHNEQIYAGNPLQLLTLYPSGKSSGLIRMQRADGTVTAVQIAAHRYVYSGVVLLLLAIPIGFLLLKKCHHCAEHQQQAESRQIELDGVRLELEKTGAEADQARQNLAEALAAQTESSEARTALQSRINQLEATVSEYQALTDTLQAELDNDTGQPADSVELDKAYTTISELKGLLEQCNSALAASHKEQNEQLSKIQTLEQRLETARQDVKKQEQLLINKDAGSSNTKKDVDQLKKQNASMEARIISLQQSYMASLEEFQTYREEFELQQARQKPSRPMPPQMEFSLGVSEPMRPQKEVELPTIVTRLRERLVARKSLPAPFNLQKLCEKAMASQEREAQNHGLEFALNLADETPDELAGDPLSLQLLIANLLRFNSEGTSDGSVALGLAVNAKPNNEYELSIQLKNSGCSRSLHPWTDWIANPHQADCHENEIAAEWCAQLITRLGGKFAPNATSKKIEFTVVLPIQLTRSLPKTDEPVPAKQPDLFG
jgi:hypothetical protein